MNAPRSPYLFTRNHIMFYKHSLLKSIGMLAAASAFCVVMAPSQADARPGYVNNIPNGEAMGIAIGGSNCALCHNSSSGGGGRGDATAFGVDIRDNSPGGPVWASIYMLDSDGDGASNGEELCDPMGAFMSGDTPPVCEFTDPSDPNDKPAPGEVDMGMDMAPEADMGTDMAPEADMGTPVEDMGTPVEDMGTPAEDMGTPTADMGVTPAVDMGGTPAADMGTAGADMGTAGADMGSTTGGGDADEEDDEGCSQTGGGSPVGGGLTLLGMLGMLGIMRKRRR